MRVQRAAAGMSAFVVAALLAAMAGGPAQAQTPESGRVVFDLGTSSTSVREHTARIAWHLTGDNIVRSSSVSAAWFSSYLDQSGELDGWVDINLDTGVVQGEITEQWSCGADCQGWAYRDGEFTATITDGRVTADDGLWRIGGKVTIAYRARGGIDEDPSSCGGVECYICVDRFCTFDRARSVSTTLKGTLDGDTLSLFFFDRLAEDPATMDMGPLADTEYFMSRFAVTVEGSVPGPDMGGTTTGATIPAVGLPIPGVDAGAPPGPDDFEDTDKADNAPTATNSTGQAQGPDQESTKRGAGWLIAIIVLIGIVGGALVVGWLVRVRMGWGAKDAAIDAAAELGVTVKPADDSGFLTELGDAARQLKGDTPTTSPALPMDPPTAPPTTATTPAPSASAAPPPPPPPPPPPMQVAPTYEQTPSKYYADQPGLKPGSYRSIEFEDAVILYRPGSGTSAETITTQFKGPTLVGEPDPGFPQHTPVYKNDGTRVGWVRTEDIPG